MKKNILLIIILIASVLSLSACKEEHVHNFSEWTNTVEPSCEAGGISERSCIDCGFIESQTLEALGHHEVVDAAVRKTCSESGLTSGSHCKRCGLVIKEQQDTGFAEHKYTEIRITRTPTCQAPGIKRYGCENCSDYYTEEIVMEELSPSEVYESASQYVGVLETYIMHLGNGTKYKYTIGTAFVYSSDGKIVTSYRLINGACSATFTLDGKTYDVVSVLAYDKEADLAILKVNAKNLPIAPVCELEHEVGSKIYCIGSSKDYTESFSQGIITHAKRKVDGVNYIQHDAAVSSSDYGNFIDGVLVNTYGEVIGLNVKTGTDAQNLNFALPMSKIAGLEYGDAVDLTGLLALTAPKYDRSVFDACYDWIKQNGKDSNNNKLYCVSLIESYNDGIYLQCTDKSGYKTVFVDYEYYLDDGNKLKARLILDEIGVNYLIAYAVYDDNGDFLWGMESCVSAITFNPYTEIFEFEVYQGKDSIIKTEKQINEGKEFCAVGIKAALVCFEAFLQTNEFGTIKDLGFVSFYGE